MYLRCWSVAARKIFPWPPTCFDLVVAPMCSACLPPQISSYRVRDSVKGSQTCWPKEWPVAYRRSPPTLVMPSALLATPVLWYRRKIHRRLPQQSGSWLENRRARGWNAAAERGRALRRILRLAMPYNATWNSTHRSGRSALECLAISAEEALQMRGRMCQEFAAIHGVRGRLGA